MGLAPLRLPDAIDKLRARSLIVPARAKTLPLGLELIDDLLPDEGLPRGAVVELCSSAGLARLTQVALFACVAAQREGQESTVQDGDSSWCAWVDTSKTLFAPGAERVGVKLERLLVVRPPVDAVARVAVRLASSRVFSVLVIDRSSVPGGKLVDRRTRWSTAVRRLSLAVEGSDTTVLLLSSVSAARAQPLPVAMRVELARPTVERMSLRISKERYGRLRGPQMISLASRGSDAP